MKKKVGLLLTNHWNDWEASYTIAIVNTYSDYEVVTISNDNTPKVSMGGLQVKIDYDIYTYSLYDETSVIILPGSLSWETCEDINMVSFIKKCINKGIVIASICGGTTFLGKHGFLNTVKHTADSDTELSKFDKYTGKHLFVNKQLVFDKGIITANETAAVQFAYEIFKYLQIDTTEEIELWYQNFSHGVYPKY